MTHKKDPGAALGKRLADLFAETYHKARGATLPSELAIKTRHQTAFLEDMEREIAPVMQRLFSKYTDSPDLPDGLRAMFELMQGPEHQWDVLLQLLGALGAGISGLFLLGPIELIKLEQQLKEDYCFGVLPPADLADAVERSLIDPETGAAWAKKSQLPNDQFDLLVELTGEPPGPMEVLSLWRRGLISKDELEQAIRYSRIRNQYIPWIEELAHSYMSPADAIELTIKGVVDKEQGREHFRVAGGLDDQFEMLYEGAGDAVGTQQVLTLWNHGLATEADVDATLGRSRINPIFYPLAKKLRNRWMGVFQIERMLQAGGCTPEQATKWLTEDGLPADQVAAFVSMGTKKQSTTLHVETEGMVVQLYTDQVITAAEAETQLTNLGYHADVAKMIIELADAKRSLSQRNTAVAAIRSAYLARRIDKAKASGDLDLLNIPAAARDTWLTAWAIERDTKMRELTTAEIGAMAKKGVLSYPHAVARWVGMGYSAEDAALLAANYGGPVVPGSPAADAGSTTP